MIVYDQSANLKSGSHKFILNCFLYFQLQTWICLLKNKVCVNGNIYIDDFKFSDKLNTKLLLEWGNKFNINFHCSFSFVIHFLRLLTINFIYNFRMLIYSYFPSEKLRFQLFLSADNNIGSSTNWLSSLMYWCIRYFVFICSYHGLNRHAWCTEAVSPIARVYLGTIRSSTNCALVRYRYTWCWYLWHWEPGIALLVSVLCTMGKAYSRNK